MSNRVYSGSYTIEGSTRIYNKNWPAGSVFRGNASWFGGSGDSMDNGSADNSHGIAFPSTATRGGYFAVRAPNGTIRIVRQIDYGPAEWTGNPAGSRILDVLFNTVRDFGYTTANFPTDKGTWTAVYIGMQPKKGLGNATRQIGDALGITYDEAAKLIGESDSPAAPGSISAVAGGIKDATVGVAETVAKLGGKLLDPQFWVNVGKVMAGIILITVALMRFTGNGPSYA